MTIKNILDIENCHTVVLANGQFPQHEIPLSLLHGCKHLVSCDGATNELVKYGRIPDAIVGDCDSLSDENKVKYASIIHRVSDQETNDLTKAMRYCESQGWKDITIIGATGKREDHTIANISLLCEYMELGKVTMVTDYGIFRAIDKPTIFRSYEGQQVSIFCLDHTPLSAKGLVYPIEDKVYNRWWQATLNEAVGDEFEIVTHGATIVYREF